MSGMSRRKYGKKRAWRNFAIVKALVCAFLVIGGLYQVGWTRYRHLAGAKQSYNKLPHLPQSISSSLEGVMKGYLTLISITVPRTGLTSTASQSYRDVRAVFCHIHWELQQNDPSKVPMFNDLRSASKLCPGTTYNVDLFDVTKQARDYDRNNHSLNRPGSVPVPLPVPPTMVVFHETRCGSTLIANLLASFLPKQTRVFSESPPPVEALMACNDGRHCDPGAQSALIQDVFYMMGRTAQTEQQQKQKQKQQQPQYVFYKIQSIGSRSLIAFTEAMPHTPWIFNYRESVEVMMSHFKNYQAGKPVPNRQNFAVCLRYWGKFRVQHPILLEIVALHNTTWDKLSKEEYCAAHLASLAEAAIREHKSLSGTTTPHWFVNYNTLPQAMWEDKILETVLQRPVDADMINRMKAISATYSKGRESKRRVWEEDSAMKQDKAPEVIRNAARKFLDPVFAQMEAFRIQ